MRDSLSLGPVPSEEEPEQVGEHYDPQKARDQCRLYIDLIRKKFGPEPIGARLKIKSNPHDFGSYLDVECEFDDRSPLSTEYCYAIENDTPQTWEDTEKVDWQANLRKRSSKQRDFDLDATGQDEEADYE